MVWQEHEIRQMIREEINNWSGDAECRSMDLNVEDAGPGLNFTAKSGKGTGLPNAPTVGADRKK